ncbi:hypothetical protein CLV42_107138 [Chitinophaga ginsengisoli]|uniref:Uncharacterized protein n=1 Tax=Chitinophaga ginsengisoli TaxID=363837 RepID=A0A2P8G4T4_9BACT|nr:hypothetical protein CLV42_107138 [Chitinophaga ginsengisoli]
MKQYLLCCSYLLFIQVRRTHNSPQTDLMFTRSPLLNGRENPGHPFFYTNIPQVLMADHYFTEILSFLQIFKSGSSFFEGKYLVDNRT